MLAILHTIESPSMHPFFNISQGWVRRSVKNNHEAGCVLLELVEAARFRVKRVSNLFIVAQALPR
jgi:hypothetical protein